MNQPIGNLWISSVPAEFESSFGLSESIERLKATTRRSMFHVFLPGNDLALGTVKESRVSLRRLRSVPSNPITPFFRGRFIERDGKVILVGRFTLYPTRILLPAVWFGFFGVIGILAMRAHPPALEPLLGSGIVFAFGTCLLVLFEWFSRNDIAWLSDVIRRALAA